MTWTIGMPNLGHTMDEGKVAQWLKRVGDPVAKGEVIVVVETDKSNFDVESPGDGVLLSIDVADGSVVPVGTAIGVVGLPDGASTSARSGRAVPDRAERSQDTEIALSPMRRAIADATQHAWQTVPRVALTSHATIDALVESGAPVTAAIGRAAALALSEHGGFNGWLLDDGFRLSRRVNLAFAVSVTDGLVTAVVPAAETKSIAAIDTELKDLAEQAREGSLDGSRMLGASFTISSLGRWGVDFFDPIISPPQVAILGVGCIARVAQEAADGGVRFASRVNLTLVFDHRANDGVAAAQLLQSIVAFLEEPRCLEAGS